MKHLTKALLLAFCLISWTGTQSADLADDWEAEPTESLVDIKPATHTEKPVSEPQSKEDRSALGGPLWQPADPRKLKVEIGIFIFVVVYIINIFRGRRANDGIINEWAKAFCTRDGVFDKNFTMVGAGHKAPLIKESGSQYKLYCSGRRFCKSLSATIQLKKRQDLFSVLLGLVWPDEDKINIDVFMKDGCMPLTVIAVATKKVMRGILQEETGEDDVRTLTRKLEVKTPGWPTDKLQVYGEHSSIFQDLISGQILDAIFRRPAFDNQGKFFRLLHITPEQSYGTKDQKSVIRFSFALPPKHRMSDLTRLLSSVGVIIDLVGNFKLSGELQKRAEKLRLETDKKDDTEKTKELRDLAEERQNKKKLEESEKLKRMTPEQREKFKEKRDKVLQKRAEKKMMRRM